MLVKPEQMLLCCYWRLLQPQAALAQNPLLYAVFSFRFGKNSQSLITDILSGVAVHAQKINQGTNVCNTRFDNVRKV